MLKRNYKDIVGGALIGLLGLYVLITALQYGIGAASRMGAGYYPMLLGIAAIGLGSAIAVLGLREQTERPRIAIKPFIAVVAGLLAFFLLVDRAGLIPAVWGLTGLSSLADDDMHVFSILGLMLSVSIAAWLLFSVALGLPIAGIEGVL
jgi:hypothetical protein